MMGIVFAGAQSASILSYDEAYTIPTEESALLALRTQQIIGYETGIAKVADPLGGSYYLENLTNRLEREIEKLILEIEGQGGMLRCIETGKIQMDVAKNAYEIEKKKQNGETVVVGVNRFADEQRKDEEIVLTTIDPKIKEKQIEKLRSVKSRRDNSRVRESLQKLQEEARGNRNMIPAIQTAVKEYATVGEICNCLKEVFGEHKESILF
jgi:methylmalonyl-CoA mutase N-terminal domain/subunit